MMNWLSDTLPVGSIIVVGVIVLAVYLKLKWMKK